MRYALILLSFLFFGFSSMNNKIKFLLCDKKWTLVDKMHVDKNAITITFKSDNKYQISYGEGIDAVVIDSTWELTEKNVICIFNEDCKCSTEARIVYLDKNKMILNSNKGGCEYYAK